MKNKNNPFNRLFAIAEAQQSYFTTKQANEVGYPNNTHTYHVKVGDWIREDRGIYRLKNFPVAEHPDMVRWSLWSRNKQGKAEGVFSHETALSLYDLSDVMPSKLHMTVPPMFRRMGKTPKILILHKVNLRPENIAAMPGFRVTQPLRAITDVLQAGSLSEDQISLALREGLKRGLIRRSEIDKINGVSPSAKEKLNKMMKELNQ